MFSIFNVQDEVLSDGLWHHMCIARSYSDGKWTFYSDGVEKLEGVDLGTDYSTEIGFMIIGKFRGNMSRFNMWDEYIADVSRIEKIAHACSSITGNVVPWSEVYLWRRGTVLKENTSVCNFFGESYKLKEKTTDHVLRAYCSGYCDMLAQQFFSSLPQRNDSVWSPFLPFLLTVNFVGGNMISRALRC